MGRHSKLKKARKLPEKREPRIIHLTASEYKQLAPQNLRPQDSNLIICPQGLQDAKFFYKCGDGDNIHQVDSFGDFVSYLNSFFKDSQDGYWCVHLGNVTHKGRHYIEQKTQRIPPFNEFVELGVGLSYHFVSKAENPHQHKIFVDWYKNNAREDCKNNPFMIVATQDDRLFGSPIINDGGHYFPFVQKQELLAGN